MSTTDPQHHEKATATTLCACGEAPDGYGLPTDHGQWMVWDQWLREHIAAALAERDERLREARETAAWARAHPTITSQVPVVLDDQITRLDAVVTAVREVRDEHEDSAPNTMIAALNEALDGGAA